jgi:DNA-directed RNA polymerase beta' subunit
MSIDAKILEKLADEELLTAHAVAEEFLTISLREFIKRIELKYLPTDAMKDRVGEMSKTCLMTYEDYQEEWWVTLARDLDLLDINVQPQNWVILVEFHVDKCADHNLTLDDIAEKIQTQSMEKNIAELLCAVSPNAIGRIEVYANFEKIKNRMSKMKPELPLASAVNARHLFEDYDLNYLLARDTVVNFLYDVEIEGVGGIHKISVSNTGTETCPKWVATTLGTNLKELFALDNIAFAETISNDMYEIWRTLGIEAARVFMRNEITKVLCFDGANINHRHVSLLVDSMTRRGSITSVTRDGVKADASVLSRLMFEMPTTIAASASVFGEKDPMTSMSAAIMMGTLANTGMSQAKVFDQDKLPSRTFAQRS